jgi:enamine deaminase RidA (YjgF/YER057c/UK114 family)
MPPNARPARDRRQVRRIYLTGGGYWREVARAHGEVFAAVRPVATAVIVAGLLDPAWLVEIEAEALRPGTGAGLT